MIRRGGSPVAKKEAGISFELDDEHRRAIESIAGRRSVRLMGSVRGSEVQIDFVACNAAFVACNAAFAACNAPFAKAD